MGQLLLGQPRQEGVEIGHAVAERGVDAGLVVAGAILVAGVIRIDQVDVVDAA